MDFKIENIIMNQIGKILILGGDRFNKLKYLALREKSNGLYYLEFGFNKNNISLMKVKSCAEEVQNSLFEFFQVLEFFEIPAIGSEFKENETDFEALTNTASNTKKQTLKAGSTIYSQGNGFERGTLGSFVKLKDKNDLFILSNFHVLFNDFTKLGYSVFDYSTDIKIGEVYWGLFNNYYDIALAKVTCDALCEKISDTFNYDFGTLTITPNQNKNISMTGGRSGYSYGQVYSTQAHAFVENKWRINQIFLKDLRAQPGDSGTLVVEGSIEKERDVVGLLFAKDREEDYISIANPLNRLLTKEIKPHIQNGTLMPSIHFDSFY